MPRQRRTVALVSGGVESAALLDHLSRRGDVVWPVYIRGGYVWESAELAALRRLLAVLRRPRLKPLTVLNAPAPAPFGKNDWSHTGKKVPGASSPDDSVYLPGRNLLLLSTAALFCALKKLDGVALGTLECNPFPDARPEYFSAMAAAASTALERTIRIEAPFRKLSKPEVIKRAGDLPWELTFSCLAPARGRPCGRCNKCAERRKALKTA